MDFTPDEAETEVCRLAAQVLAGSAGQKSTAAAADFDAALWKELADAGLLSLAVPAELGGDGLGVQAVTALLTEVGRHAARIPALATLALGVLPVTRAEEVAARAELLAGVANGGTILTAAIREPSEPMPLTPVTRLDGTSGTVSGVKVGVPYAAAAQWILVSAGREDGGTARGGAAVVAVASDSPGVSRLRTRSSSGLPEYTVLLEQAPIRHVLHGCTAADLHEFAVAGACAVADGALAAALDLTTRHIRTREQFGRPLAAFQAVAQQIADVYAAARTLHLATVSACWRLETGRDAGADADVAAYWLAQHAPAALRTCHHLHGGLGMDVSYPLPRYSALITDLVSLVGGADYRLDRLAAREGACSST
jgi:3-oxo-4-pregnene-20-carboxyl-CoA dehydrogenase alpha subunit